MAVPVPPTVVTLTVGRSTDFNDLSDAVAFLLGTKPHAVMTRSTALTIAHATDQPLVWGVEEVDNRGGHSNSTDPERFNAPEVGYYRVEAWLQWDINATGIRQLSLIKNGTANVGTNESTAHGATGTDVSCAMTVYLGAGDWIEVHGYQTSGGNLAIVAGRFAISWSHSF